MGIITVNTDFEKLFGITEREYYAKQYLTFEMLEDQDVSIYWSIDFIDAEKTMTQISFSIDDGKTWTNVELDDNEEYEIGMLKKGQKILFKGNGGTYNHSSKTYLKIIPDDEITVYGNIMSLIYGDDFYGKNFDIMKLHSFGYLFAGISTILDVHNLILPTNTVKRCYMHMFDGCAGITTAPELPATYIEQQAYESMFEGCRKFAYVASPAYGYINTGGTTNWLKDVAATGTFVCNFESDWTKGASGIPTGWEKKYFELPTPTQTVDFRPIAGVVLEGDEIYLTTNGWITGIKFTTDGSNPTADSKTYEDGDIVIEEATTVKAAAFNSDDVDFKMGPISTADYTIVTPSLVMYVDKFPPQGDTGVGDYNYEENTGMTRAEYMEATVAAPEDYMSDKYIYYGVTINIDNTTYNLWRGVGQEISDLFLLTTTADYDTLSAQSIAEEGDVPFTSMYALATSEDDEFNVYEVNTESEIPRQLVKIENYTNGE